MIFIAEVLLLLFAWLAHFGYAFGKWGDFRVSILPGCSHKRKAMINQEFFTSCKNKNVSGFLCRS